MTTRAKFEQMLEYLINEDRAKAEELFHDLVVAKSREIYESLLDDEIGGDPSDDLMGDVGVADDADDEFGGADDFGGNDDFGGEDELDGEFSDEGSTEPATKADIQDIKDAVDDLAAEFQAMLDGGDFGSEGGEENLDDFSDDEFSGSDDDTEEETGSEDFGGEDDEEQTEEGYVREYVERVAAGHGPEKKGSGESNVNAKSIVAGKNNMGGTTANIARGGVGSEKGTQGGLLNPSAKDLNTKNVNVPGSKTATKLSGVAKGHGPEKKGAGETGASPRSIIGSRS